jgi:hypothetical protein
LARKYYEWQHIKDQQRRRKKKSFRDAAIIRGRGLAKISWMWAMSSLGINVDRKPIPGVALFYPIKRVNECGYVKKNMLSYLLKTIPADWRQEVEYRAGARIMGQYRRQMEVDWMAAMSQSMLNRRLGKTTLLAEFNKAA